MEPEFSIFYITCPHEKIAQKISETLLYRKLIACSNMLPGMTSQYWWEGKLETSQEIILLLKAKSSQKAPIEKLVKELHPAQVPCFLQIAIEDGSPEYLNWLGSI